MATCVSNGQPNQVWVTFSRLCLVISLAFISCGQDSSWLSTGNSSDELGQSYIRAKADKQELEIGEEVTISLHVKLGDVNWRLMPMPEGYYVMLQTPQLQLLLAILSKIGTIDVSLDKNDMLTNLLHEKLFRQQLLNQIQSWRKKLSTLTDEKDVGQNEATTNQSLGESLVQVRGLLVDYFQKDDHRKHLSEKDEEGDLSTYNTLTLLDHYLESLPKIPALYIGAVVIRHDQNPVDDTAEVIAGTWRVRYYVPGKWDVPVPDMLEITVHDGQEQRVALGVGPDAVTVTNPFAQDEEIVLQEPLSWLQPPKSYWFYAFVFLIMALIVVVMVGAIHFYQQRKLKAQAIREFVLPSKKFYQKMQHVQKQLLSENKRDGQLLDRQLLLEEATVSISFAFRDFIESALSFPALEMDTETLLRGIVDGLPNSITIIMLKKRQLEMPALANCLHSLDMVKFAKGKTTVNDLTETITFLKRWVNIIAGETEGPKITPDV